MARCKIALRADWIIPLTRILCLLEICQRTQGQICSWTFTQPRTDSNTSYIRSVGSTATFTAQVAGEVMTNADRITWKGNNSDLIQLRYSSSSGTSTVLSAKPGVVASSSDGRHSMTISDLTLNDSMVISVISGGCTVNDVSQKIKLEVKYCDLDYFKPTATAVAHTSPIEPCGCNCVQRFDCAESDGTSTATCTENARWAPATATCGVDWTFSVALTICVIGSVFSFILLGLVFMIRNCGKRNSSVLNVCILASMCVAMWIISLGLLFGLKYNVVAFVAGCSLAALSFLGMLVMVVVLIVRLVHKRI